MIVMPTIRERVQGNLLNQNVPTSNSASNLQHARQ